jgi:hypothetical protein
MSLEEATRCWCEVAEGEDVEDARVMVCVPPACSLRNESQLELLSSIKLLWRPVSLPTATTHNSQPIDQVLALQPV